MEGNQPNYPQPNQPNSFRRPIPFLPGLFVQLMPQDILQESMNDETPDKPAKKDFIDSLEEITVDQNMIDEKISCSICLDEFKINEKCIKLPCENPHYFHIGENKDVCEGIKPWFQINHNCPVCRCEFPEEETKIESSREEEEQEEVEGEEEEGENQLMNRFNQLLREDPVENIIFPPLFNIPINPINSIRPIRPIRRINPLNQIINDVIEREEDRQLQEAIRLSLENN